MVLTDCSGFLFIQSSRIYFPIPLLMVAHYYPSIIYTSIISAKITKAAITIYRNKKDTSL